MAMSNQVLVLAVVVVLSLVNAQAVDVDITKHGAVSNGYADSAPAILAAFKTVCASATPSNIVVPKGNFYLKQIKIEGPCKSTVGIKLIGSLRAPGDPSALDPSSDWFNVRQLNGFKVFGGGNFDGSGKVSWDMKIKGEAPKLMAMLSLAFVTNAEIHGVSFTQSKNTHIHLFGCKKIAISNILIDSPDESPNTDGIKMGSSSDVSIVNSTIRSGDDCLAILSGTVNLTASGLICGPGHGFSVGSMGGNAGEAPIDGIHIKNSTLIGTMNGVRIKSWGSKNKAVANDITFEDINMTNVENPILIDQEYCPARNCQKSPPSHVSITNVKIANVKGTTATQTAVNLICSAAVPCQNITISNVDLKFNGGKAISTCKNVKPILSGAQSVAICAAGAPSSDW